MQSISSFGSEAVTVSGKVDIAVTDPSSLISCVAVSIKFLFVAVSQIKDKSHGMIRNIRSWLEQMQRFSLIMLLSGSMMVQFMHMAGAAQASADDCVVHCDHTLTAMGDVHSGRSQAAGDHGAQTSVCSMMACLADVAHVTPILSVTQDVLAADFDVSDTVKIAGSFVSQLGKPPKTI